MLICRGCGMGDRGEDTLGKVKPSPEGDYHAPCHVAKSKGWLDISPDVSAEAPASSAVFVPGPFKPRNA